MSVINTLAYLVWQRFTDTLAYLLWPWVKNTIDYLIWPIVRSTLAYLVLLSVTNILAFFGSIVCDKHSSLFGPTLSDKHSSLFSLISCDKHPSLFSSINSVKHSNLFFHFITFILYLTSYTKLECLSSQSNIYQQDMCWSTPYCAPLFGLLITFPLTLVEVSNSLKRSSLSDTNTPASASSLSIGKLPCI